MDQTVLQQRLTIFALIWVALAIVAVLFVARTKEVRRKQKALPWFGAAFGAVFIGATQCVGLPTESLLVIIPGVALIVFLNLRSIRFCPKCNAYNVSTSGLRVKHCRSCGESLEKTPL